MYRQTHKHTDCSCANKQTFNSKDTNNFNATQMKSKNNVGISPSLKNLLVHKSFVFDLTVFKYSSIDSTIQRIQSDTSMRFTKTKNSESKTLEVIRTA